MPGPSGPIVVVTSLVVAISFLLSSVVFAAQTQGPPVFTCSSIHRAVPPPQTLTPQDPVLVPGCARLLTIGLQFDMNRTISFTGSWWSNSSIRIVVETALNASTQPLMPGGYSTTGSFDYVLPPAEYRVLVSVNPPYYSYTNLTVFTTAPFEAYFAV